MSEPNDQPQEEYEESWSGTDAMLCFIGAGVFALLALIGLGQCTKAEQEGKAALERARNEARANP